MLLLSQSIFISSNNVIFSLMMESLRAIIEKYSFGVCSYLAQKMGLRSSRVRLYFIYTSFVTMGSPIIIYL